MASLGFQIKSRLAVVQKAPLEFVHDFSANAARCVQKSSG